MPRTGGVYSPPAGTKGVPGTTIQSVPYNTWVDDLTADANAARPVTAGGTGSTTASAARAALGLAIGTDVQAQDPGLQSIAGLTTSANQMIYTTGSDTYATTSLTAFARSVLDDGDAATARDTLATIGRDSISYAGFAGNVTTSPYFTRISDGLVYYLWGDAASPRSLAASGYQKLPSGLLLQWGSISITGGDLAVFFPISFPAACFGVHICSAQSTPNPTTTLYAAEADSWSTSAFAAHGRFASNGGSVGVAAINAVYLAIGN